jgi:colanic acid biosynthesis glycosyl transferase WcaI
MTADPTVASKASRGEAIADVLPLAGRSVCVVGMNYAPEHTGIAPYTTGLAEIAAELGANVEVLTGVPHYPSWSPSPEYRWRLRAGESRNGVTVRRARHFVPSKPSALPRLLWDGTYLLNTVTMRPRTRPDVVIGVTPSLGGAAAAARWARAYRAPLGIVVQDLVGQAARQSGMAGAGGIAGAAAKAEAALLRRADRVAIISAGMHDQVVEFGVADEKVVHFPNWTHIEPDAADTPVDRPAARRELGWEDDAFVVLHTGNMGLKQDLGNVIEAARLVGAEEKIVFVLLGDGSQRPELETQGTGVGALQFHPPVADDLYPKALRAADLLLVNELPSVGEMSLPSKLTSYFAAGQPVLAAVSDGGACAREIAATRGAGVRVDPATPEALVEAVRSLRSQPQEMASMGEAASGYAQRALGRGTATANVLALVTSLLDVRQS